MDEIQKPKEEIKDLLQNAKIKECVDEIASYIRKHGKAIFNQNKKEMEDRHRSLVDKYIIHGKENIDAEDRL